MGKSCTKILKIKKINPVDLELKMIFWICISYSEYVYQTIEHLRIQFDGGTYMNADFAGALLYVEFQVKSTLKTSRCATISLWFACSHKHISSFCSFFLISKHAPHLNCIKSNRSAKWYCHCLAKHVINLTSFHTYLYRTLNFPVYFLCYKLQTFISV